MSSSTYTQCLAQGLFQGLAKKAGAATVLGMLVTMLSLVPEAQAQHGPGGLPGRPGRDWSPPGFVRGPDRGMPGVEAGNPPPRFERVVTLDDAVSMVQSRFNATAVKTDTMMDGGQLVYRIRLLSADRSRVWTVSVDARSGQIN